MKPRARRARLRLARRRGSACAPSRQSLREAAGPAQLAAEALARARGQLIGRNAQAPSAPRGRSFAFQREAGDVAAEPRQVEEHAPDRRRVARPSARGRASGSTCAKPAVGGTMPRASASRSSASSAGPLAPSVWPIAPLNDTMRGGAANVLRTARASARSPIGLPPACSFRRSTSLSSRRRKALRPSPAR